ncbi:MAG: 16S rRNA (cytosine(1402)-N(4))-methyltransferase RsmH [Candidatus Saccharimonadales bacterium]
MKTKNKQHEPVLLKEVMQLLNPKKGESYLDLTAGYGGHSRAVLDRTKRPDLAVLIDRDEQAIEELKQNFDSSVSIVHEDFYSASQRLADVKKQFDLILADLGVSSPHLNEGSRGFSFQHDGPLDMRMDQRQKLNADTIINTFTKEEIDKLLKAYGEEPRSKLIAKTIIDNRPIRSTAELSAIIAAVYGGKAHHNPATRTFQALRIAVNDELKLLTNSLPLWLKLLSPGGRLAVISFHSLEDRIVKQFFAEYSGSRYDSILKLLTKHPVHASSHEIVHNPRARSAKLRAVVKIKRKGVVSNANSG